MSNTHPQEEQQETCDDVSIQSRAGKQPKKQRLPNPRVAEASSSASRSIPLDRDMAASIVKWFNVDHKFVSVGLDCHLFTCSSASRTVPAWLTTLPLIEDTNADRNKNRGHHIGRTVQNFHQFNQDGTIPIYNKYPGFQWERVFNSRNELSLIDDVPELKLLAQLVESVFNIPKESVHSIVTKYLADGAIHKHQDGPRTLHPTSFIVVFSYGFDTELMFVPLPDVSYKYLPFTIVIPHGSVFLLGAETNRMYTHCIQPNNTAVVKTAVQSPQRFSIIFRHCTNLVTFNEVYTKMMNSRKKKELTRMRAVCRYIQAPVPAATPIEEKQDQNTEVIAPPLLPSTVDATQSLRPKKRKIKCSNKTASGTNKQQKKSPRSQPKHTTVVETVHSLRATRTKEHGDCLYTEMRERSDLVVRVDPTGLFSGIHKARQGAVGGCKYDEGMGWLNCDVSKSDMVLLVDCTVTTNHECECIHERIKISFRGFCNDDEDDADAERYDEKWEVVESVPHGVYQVGSTLTTNFQDDCSFILKEADVAALFCEPALYDEFQDSDPADSLGSLAVEREGGDARGVTTVDLRS
jgi:hypothetical protein